MFIIIKKKQILLIMTFALTILLFISAGLFASISLNNSSKQTLGNGHKYIILIYIEEKKLYLFEDGKYVKSYTIASGKPGWPSPIGNWKIINKGDWGEGFGGYWLGLDVKWGEYGIHGTIDESSIGMAASHGCIRMYKSDIKELYNTVPIGTTVIIKNGPFGPFGTGFRVLEPGDRGADVLAVQHRLKILGYFNGDESGIYEDDLKHALHKFQKDKNLKVENSITLDDYNAMGFKEFE